MRFLVGPPIKILIQLSEDGEAFVALAFIKAELGAIRIILDEFLASLCQMAESQI